MVNAQLILSVTRRLAVVLGVALAVVLMALVGMTQTSFGRDQMRLWIMENVSQRIQGTIHIDQITRIDPWKVVVEGFRAKDSQRKEVVVVEKAILQPDLWSLFSAQLRFAQSDVYNGKVLLREGPSDVSLLEAFSQARSDTTHKKETESQDKSSDSDTSVWFSMTIIRFHDFRVVLDLGMIPEVLFRGIEGFGKLSLGEEVVFRLDKVSAKAEFPIVGQARIKDATGRIHGSVFEVMRLSSAVFIKNWVKVQARYFVPSNKNRKGDPHLKLSFDKSTLNEEGLALLAAKLGDMAIPRLEVSFSE